MLGRSLYIDESTAKFYLQDAGGDMKAAMEAFGEGGNMDMMRCMSMLTATAAVCLHGWHCSIIELMGDAERLARLLMMGCRSARVQ